ncbi:hypothetical protein KY284_020076 [Solanum tuberosum]|nr:hypothetical protein KY284_020076 [Solanum tuberosum]
MEDGLLTAKLESQEKRKEQEKGEFIKYPKEAEAKGKRGGSWTCDAFGATKKNRVVGGLLRTRKTGPKKGKEDGAKKGDGTPSSLATKEPDDQRERALKGQEDRADLDVVLMKDLRLSRRSKMIKD